MTFPLFRLSTGLWDRLSGEDIGKLDKENQHAMQLGNTWWHHRTSALVRGLSSARFDESLSEDPETKLLLLLPLVSSAGLMSCLTFFLLL